MPVFTADPGTADTDLEPAIAAVEVRLEALGEALLERSSAGVEQCAQELQKSLTDAVTVFSHAARRGSVPGGLRQRLVKATGEVAARRESLARATVALDRALEVLMPRGSDTVYSSRGSVIAKPAAIAQHAVAA